MTRKVELDDEQRRRGMDAVEIGYEMGAKNSTYEIPAESLRRSSGRQELCRDIDASESDIRDRERFD